MELKTKKWFLLFHVRISILDFYYRHEKFFRLNEKYQPQRLHQVLSKYSKHRSSVGEIEDYYNEVSKH